MEKRHAIIESATRLFGSIGFDATTTLEIANEADVTEPLIYYHFKGKHELFKISLDLAFNEYFSRLVKLPKHTPTEFQKIVNIIDLHFQKKIKKARKLIMDYISGCLKAGISSGEFLKIPVSPTANTLVALFNGLLRQRVYQLNHTVGVKAATIDFCRRSLTGCCTIQ